MVLFSTIHQHLHPLSLLPRTIRIPHRRIILLPKTLILPDPTKGPLRISLPVGVTLKFAPALSVHIPHLLLPQFTCGMPELGPYQALLRKKTPWIWTYLSSLNCTPNFSSCFVVAHILTLCLLL